MRKKITVGILAHVDAGKTTLAESILYCSGQIRNLGRVDHKNAFLDNDIQERERGITIFSKQAQVMLEDMELTLLDTPGHVDFSAEMERTLGVLDYAILVISASDGIQGHVLTIWSLLQHYDIPVFLFINKMDQPDTDREKILEELQNRLHSGCIDFGENSISEFYDSIAMCSHALLEEFLDKDSISGNSIKKAIRQRVVFPCYFGSALKLEGIREFLQGFEQYVEMDEAEEAFGARIFKITRDENGNRLTHVKITSGKIRVKDLVMDEKINQIRMYSGTSFVSLQEAEQGTVCQLLGLTRTYPGMGIGTLEKEERAERILEPVLNYKIILPSESDVYQSFLKLKQIEEEEPQIHLEWNERLNEIHIRMMGGIQIEIFKHMIQERFQMEVEFDKGSILYKETIDQMTYGVGHFEPLRHYAEVHLRLEPLPAGSGIQIASECREEILGKNWQNLILHYLSERRHRGPLINAELTDVKITLIAGKAHPKHTEGGDFQQATYRALRQGLLKNEMILLEPTYYFEMELPENTIGRAMSDIQSMGGSFEAPYLNGEFAGLKGNVPVLGMREYQREFASYSRGFGKLTLIPAEYAPCKEQERIVEESDYCWESDSENPGSSVFCAHGAGFLVPWDEVEQYQHIVRKYDRGDTSEKRESQNSRPKEWNIAGNTGKDQLGASLKDEKELEEIFNRTYNRTDTLKKKKWQNKKNEIYIPGGKEEVVNLSEKVEDKYLLVDGYNIIFAWEELKEIAKVNLEAARARLMEILSNYQGFKKINVILVFDAYKVEGGQGSEFKYNQVDVIFTKQAQTADQYIEKTVQVLGRTGQVSVATSDAAEQMIIWGQGGLRVSARELQMEIERTCGEISAICAKNEKGLKNYINIPEKTAKKLE